MTWEGLYSRNTYIQVDLAGAQLTYKLLSILAVVIQLVNRLNFHRN